MKNAIFLSILVTFTVSSAYGNLIQRPARSTTVIRTSSIDGNLGPVDIRTSEDSIDYKGTSVSTSTTSKVTTSTLPSSSEVTYETVPLNLFIQKPGAAVISEGSSLVHTSSVLDGYLASGVPAPTTFVRPEGHLPTLPDRFGFETSALYNSNGLPNCGCVTRGSCVGQVGAYTSQVLKYSDIVCGHQFQTCCFDGPYSGSYDIFATAAACVPKEECRRPYGVLPTDVRDFGAIAPCPGQGAVRCILVDNAGFLEFQAALSAIEAANSYSYYHQSVQYEPVHLTVPIVSSSGGSSTSVETTSTVDVQAAKTVPEPVPVPAPVIAPVLHAVPCPEKQAQKTVVVVVAPPKVQPQPPVPSQTTVITTPPVQAVKVIEPVVPAVQPVVAPYGGYTGVGYGAYPSIIGAYPGYGFGAGLGLRKRIRFSKGFGYGFGF